MDQWFYIEYYKHDPRTEIARLAMKGRRQVCDFIMSVINPPMTPILRAKLSDFIESKKDVFRHYYWNEKVKLQDIQVYPLSEPPRG